MLTFSKFYQDDNEDFRGIDEGNTVFNANQLRHYSQQLQRQIYKIANEIERKPDADTNSQLVKLSKILEKLTILLGLTLASNAQDKRILVRSNQ